MKVFDEVKEHFPETKESIDDCIEQECLKEIIVGRGNFSFYMPNSKKLAVKHFLFCSARF